MSGDRGTSNTGTSAFSSAASNTTTPINSFSFGNRKPTGGFGAAGDTLSAFQSASDRIPAGDGASGTSFLSFATSSTSNASGGEGSLPFGGGNSLFGQPKPPTAFGLANPNPPPVTTGTSAIAYSATHVNEVLGLRPNSSFMPITAMPAYQATSFEELRMQDHQQNPKTVGASGEPLAMPKSSVFGTPTTTQQSATGSIFGRGTSTGISGAFGQRQSTTNTGTVGSILAASQPQQSSISIFGQPRSAPGVGSSFGRPSPVLDSSKLDRIEELLRRLLLGEESVNTQFHLFSVRSSSAGRVMKPRVICANDALLAKSSKYFMDLLSADINPSDPSLTDLTGDNDVPGSARIDDYGYGSDSDLDDYDDPISAALPKPVRDQSAASPPSSSKVSAKAQSKDSGLSEDGSESISSDTFVVGAEHLTTDESSSEDNDGASSKVSSKTTVQESVDDKSFENQNAMRLRSLGSRHVLVKDTAFQTWYTLLNYLYTGRFSFQPLSSTRPGARRGTLANPLYGPRCSAKSMYRLASKVGLDKLRDEAFSYIRSNLNEHNILQELSCRLVSKYPQLLEMELDVLHSHIASPSVVANFAAFAKRITHEQLPHGTDIIVGIHARFLKERQSFLLRPVAPTLPPTLFGSGKLDVSSSNVPEAETKNKTGPSHEDKHGVQSGSIPSGSSEPVTSVPSRASPSTAVLTATLTKEPDAGGKKEVIKKRE